MKNPTTFTNSAIEDKLTDLLLPEEKVLWSYENAQAPAENKAFIAFGAVVTILWCIPVLGFGLPLVVGLIGSGGGLIIIFPLLFITIGVGQLVLLIYAFLRRNRFAYVVSNQLVLMLNSFQPVSHRIFEPEQLLLASTPDTGEFGTIYLTPPKFFMSPIEQYLSLLFPPKMSNIPNPSTVQALISKTLIQRHKINYEQSGHPTNNPKRKPNKFHGY
jgi:hypothetical protein